jgi:hypothetical protein
MSGFKVNFSVNNQLATPSMHAAALANRPAAGQPGRVFIDTDNPSTGIYRDTGTIWIQIGAGAGALNLQNVTDNGNSTTNNILLQYPDNAQDNALVFYNSDLAQEEYLIRKRATGILTNDVLSIESRGNISPSTDPVGLLIDGSQNVIRSFFGNSYIDNGLKLDFNNNSYKFGDYNNLSNGGAIVVNVGAPEIYTTFNIGNLGYNISQSNIVLGDYGATYNGLVLKVDFDSSGPEIIYTQYQGNDIGLKLDFANGLYQFGTATISGGIGLLVNNSTTEISTEDFLGGVNGFVVNMSTLTVSIGDYVGNANNTFLTINDANQRLELSGNLIAATAGGASGDHLKVRIGGTDYKIELRNP